MTTRCFEYAALQVVSALSIPFCMLTAVITAGVVHAAEPLPASESSATVRTYTVQRGDTLDRLIQRNMADSPLKIELLRKAFVEGNPHAFVSGNVSRLRSGVVLQVPDHNKLLRSTILPMLEGADLDSAAVTGESRSSSASDRRSWVRFP
jgi:Tfp pilus assembly protein FimV